MQYLAWRVESGLNESIEISFLLVGHTKFAPDWCFGLVKQLFRKTTVGCLKDLEHVVNQSAVTNHAQLVGTEDGTIIVYQYDWSTYFAPYFKRTAFDGIKGWHHLKFTRSNHGKCTVREYSDSTEKVIDILHKDHLDWKPNPEDLPPEIQPPGLSKERQTYLYNKIRGICT